MNWPEFKFPPINLWTMPLHIVLLEYISKKYYEKHADLWGEVE